MFPPVGVFDLFDVIMIRDMRRAVCNSRFLPIGAVRSSS